MRAHFTKIVKKIVNSAVFEAENLLEKGLDLRKFRKNCRISRFISEKNPWIWVGVLDRGPHTLSKNNLGTRRNIS